MSVQTSSASRAEVEELCQILGEIERREQRRMFYKYFPDVTTHCTILDETFYARDMYPRHMEFFEAGSKYRERAFIAANRVGKTITGAYEVTAHATGEYPEWWKGRRFEHNVDIWAAGKTNLTTRDVIQTKLFGKVERLPGNRRRISGTGMVPADKILHGLTTWKSGVADLVDTVSIQHTSGRISTIGLKSYEQGRGSFEGTEKHAIWLDEEPPIQVYGECLIRTTTTNGIVMLSFTPLEGLSETVMQFMPEEMRVGMDA